MKSRGGMKIWITKNGNRIVQVLGGRNNVFLLLNGERKMLIDTGIRLFRKKLQRKLSQLGVCRIDLLVLTHSHFDHAGNARWIRERYHAPVIIHRDEASALETGTFILPRGTSAIPRFLINSLAVWLARRLSCEPCPCDLMADERFDLMDYGFDAYILHTPGHSPGSVSIIADNEIAMVGDTLFGIFRGSVFPPFASDASQLVHSWGKLLMTGCKTFLPSHGSANGRQLVEKDYKRRTWK